MTDNSHILYFPVNKPEKQPDVMPGKYTNELTAAELRYECRQRELSEAGAKNDLEIQLVQHFADMNLQANEMQFPSMEPTGPTVNNST